VSALAAAAASMPSIAAWLTSTAACDSSWVGRPAVWEKRAKATAAQVSQIVLVLTEARNATRQNNGKFFITAGSRAMLSMQ
jgi:hypothetical protein